MSVETNGSSDKSNGWEPLPGSDLLVRKDVMMPVMPLYSGWPPDPNNPATYRYPTYDPKTGEHGSILASTIIEEQLDKRCLSQSVKPRPLTWPH